MVRIIDTDAERNHKRYLALRDAQVYIHRLHCTVHVNCPGCGLPSHLPESACDVATGKKTFSDYPANCVPECVKAKEAIKG